MKVLIAVASKHGSTREIGATIAEELRHAGLEVEVKDMGKVAELEGYVATVLGSAIYAGNWLPEAKTFAKRFHDELEKLPVWLFSSGPLGTPDPQPHDDPHKLAAPIEDVAVRDHRIFMGKLDPSELGLAERVVVRMVGAPYGDFRNWNEVHGWAREIAADLQPAAQSRQTFEAHSMG